MFPLESTVFNLFSQPVSFLELIAVLLNTASVYLASRANTNTWVVGILANGFLMALFYDLGLYPDMLLQVFFALTAILGIKYWTMPDKTIISMRGRTMFWIVLLMIGACLSFGYVFANIDTLFPSIAPTQLPYTDSIIMVLSITATLFLVYKLIEAWLLWIAVDILGCIVYYYSGAMLLSLEYLLFLFMAIYGYLNWNRLMIQQNLQKSW